MPRRAGRGSRRTARRRARRRRRPARGTPPRGTAGEGRPGGADRLPAEGGASAELHDSVAVAAPHPAAGLLVPVVVVWFVKVAAWEVADRDVVPVADGVCTDGAVGACPQQTGGRKRRSLL